MLWKKTIYWLMTVTLIGFVGAGCVSEGEGAGDGWKICDGDDCDESTPIDNPVDEEDQETTRLSELEPCAPRAVERGVQNVPELPEEMVDGHCSLEQESYDYDGDGESERVTRWSRDGDVIEQVVEDRGRLLNETRFELDAAGELRRVHRSLHHFYYGSGRTEDEWTFDRRGRLTSHTNLRWREVDGVETLQGVREVSQTWQEGRLVARTEDASYGDTDTHQSFEWRYDAQGQLVEALVDDSPSERSQRSVWTYDDAGRPIAAERSFNGVTFVRHDWEYHDDGVVAAHDVKYGSHGLGENAADVYASASTTVDTYHTLGPYVHYSAYGGTQNPWGGANPQVDDQQGCYTLPSSVGHGYPHDEQAYELGWGEEPHRGIHFSSAYNSHGYGYGYGYGEPLWYGHAGAGTPWPAGQYASNGVVTAQLRYDAQGRMVDESLTLEPYAAADAETDSPNDSETDVQETMHIERRRHFGDTGLLDDQITVEVGDETHERSLRFERSPEGHLLLRELLQDDRRLAFQSWGHDGAGRITEHDVHVAPRTHQYPVTLAHILREETEASVHSASYERRFDQEGRVEFMGVENSLRVTRYTEITIDYGEHGPLEETQRYTSEQGESGTRTSYEYDTSGRKLAERHDYDDDGTVDRATRYVYEGDRLVEVREVSGNTTRVTMMAYVCQ